MKKLKTIRSEVIEKEIQKAIKNGSASAIKSAITALKLNNGIISIKEIQYIAEREAYKYFEITDKKEVSVGIYNNMVDYLDSCKNIKYIDNQYQNASISDNTIDDPVITSLSNIIAEYKASMEIAIEEDDCAAKLQCIKMINVLIKALIIRARTEQHVGMWLRIVLPISECYKFIDNSITFRHLYDMMLKNISIHKIIENISPSVQNLLVSEIDNRYGISKIK